MKFPLQHLICSGMKGLFVVFEVLLLIQGGSSAALQLTSSNLDETLANNELVFLNFYADWCRFSQMLKPIFDEAAEKLEKEFTEPGKLVLAKVDCDRETAIATKFHVNKYPTLKLLRNGQLVKREFRGQRSVDALANFIREQLKDSIIRVTNVDDLDVPEMKKRRIIGYFDSESSPDMAAFLKVASTLRDDCVFYAAIGPVSEKERIAGNKVVYRPIGENPSDLFYNGALVDSNLLQTWAHDKCVPLVREITFENAEELTEEGLPFMILFHHPDDTETPEKYRSQVARELLPEKSSINFLTADGLKFSHPLYHLGKTANDLPVLAIDSFRHMYMWPHSPKTDVDKPGLLKTFVADLHSGKLHREFHHGPDPATTTETPKIEAQDTEGTEKTESTGGATKEKHVRKEADPTPEEEKASAPEEKKRTATSPPESVFKKLGPSHNRYTILRDEL